MQKAELWDPGARAESLDAIGREFGKPSKRADMTEIMDASM